MPNAPVAASSPAAAGSSGGGAAGLPTGGTALAMSPVASNLPAGVSLPSLAGISDNQPPDVVTVRAATTGVPITLESPGHRIQDVQAFNTPNTDVNLPLGLIGFKVLDVTPGGSATVRMTLPRDVAVSGYYKENPASGDLVPFNYDGRTGAEINGNVVTLHLVDGGSGDADGVANGVIVDPGGPGGGGIRPLANSHVGYSWTNVSPTPVSITNPGTRTTAEGASVSLQISATSSLGYGLTYDAVGLPLGLSINQSTGLISGTIDYSDAEAFGGAYSVTAIAADGHGGSASQAFTWTVTDVDRAPTITSPGNQTSAQGDAISLQITVSDPDGDQLAYSATGLPAGLTMNGSSGLISGSVSLTAAASAPYTATVTASDGTLSANQTFTWTITNTNRTPQVTSPGNQSNARGDPISLQMSASDSDGDSLTYTATGLPPGLSIDPASGLISGSVANNATTVTPYNVTVNASDGASSASRSFTWSISHVGVGNPGDQTNFNGDVISLQIAATDSDGDTLSYSATGLPSNLSINSNTGVISGTLSNTADASSPYSVTVTVSDGTNTGSQTFTWKVVHLSLANPGNLINKQGASVSLQLAAHDSDNDTLSYSATGLPPGVSLNATTGLLSGTVGNVNTLYSPYTVTVTTADATHSASQGFLWTVTPHVVVIAPPAQSNATLDSVTLAISARDNDGDTLSYSVSGLPAGLSINSTTGIISGTISATADTASPYTSTVTVSDGTYSTSQTFTWTVSHVLVVNPGNRSNTTGDVVSLSISARDRDGDTLTYTATGLPAGLSINSSTGLISGTVGSTADSGSPYAVTVTASDPGKSNSQSFTWTVAPHISFASISNQSNGDGDVVSLPAVAVDGDGDTLSYSAGGLPAGLSINSTSGLISGTLGNSADTSSPYSVTITASDGVRMGSQTFTWTVSHISLTNPGPQTGSDGAVVSVTLQGRDVDGDTVTFSATGLPNGLGINTSTGVISGTISSTAHTSSPFNVSVTAADATHSTSQAFLWTVAHLSIASPANQTNTGGNTVSLQLSGNDSDHDTLTYSADSLPAGLSLNPSTGLISGTIAAGAAINSPYTITVAASDGTLSSSKSFTWTVNPYVTMTNPGSRSNLEGSMVSLQIQATDAGGRPLTYSAYGLPAGLTMNSSTGLISGTVSSGDSALSPYTVTVVAADNTYSSNVTFFWAITHSSDQNPSLTNPGNQGNHEGDGVALQLVAGEPDGDPLSYSATGLPDGLTIDPSTGLISGTIADTAAAIGAYAVAVAVTDPSGGLASQSFQWMVNDAGLVAQGLALAATEDSPVLGITVATFADPDLMSSANDFAATINWGDGNTSAGTVGGAAGSFSVTGTNTYGAPGSYAVSVTIVDSEGSSTSTSSTASVAAAGLSISGLTVEAIAGAAVNANVASFTDANANDAASTYTASIQWGDGASSGTISGSLGSFLIAGSHTYGLTGTYTVTVTVTDKDGTSASSTAAANVGDAFAGAAANLTAATFANVSGGTPSNSTATIAWGDGNSGTGAVSGSLGSLTATGTHVFSHGGSFTVNVTVNSTSGGSQSASGTIIVVAPSLTLYLTTVNAPANVAQNNIQVGTFTDPNPNDSSAAFSPTINWGDGSAASGTVTGSNGLFRVLGTHSYSINGIFPLSMSIPAGAGWPGPGGGGGGGGVGGGGGITNVQLVGPTAVPGFSQYRYMVSFGAAPPKGVTFVVLKPTLPAKIVDSGVITDAHGNAVGFYLDVAFLNKAAEVLLGVGARVRGGSAIIWASTIVDVVSVNIVNGTSAFSSEWKPQDSLAESNVQSPVDTYAIGKPPDDYYVTEHHLGKDVAAFQLKKPLPAKPESYLAIASKIMDRDGFVGSTEVLLEGPVQNPNAIWKITAGFIQTVKEAGTVQTSGENPISRDLYLAGTAGGGPNYGLDWLQPNGSVIPSRWPWYSIASPFMQKPNYHIISMDDSPSVIMPTQISPNRAVDEGAVAAAFTVYVGLSTSDQPDTFFEPYTVSWNMVFRMKKRAVLPTAFDGYVSITLPQKSPAGPAAQTADQFWSVLGQFQIDTDRVPANIWGNAPYATWFPGP